MSAGYCRVVYLIEGVEIFSISVSAAASMAVAFGVKIAGVIPSGVQCSTRNSQSPSVQPF